MLILILETWEILKQGKFEKLAPNVTETAKETGSSLISGAEARTLKLEEKAAKIERLKSGFRICKPQGTFLWPNMVKETINNNSSSSIDNSTSFVQVQVEVPTPPSVSSSTRPPQLLYHQPPPSIVKPVAEKRAVKVTVSTLSNTTPAAAAPVNLNDAPINLDNAMPPVCFFSTIQEFLDIYVN